MTTINNFLNFFLIIAIVLTAAKCDEYYHSDNKGHDVKSLEVKKTIHDYADDGQYRHHEPGHLEDDFHDDDHDETVEDHHDDEQYHHHEVYHEDEDKFKGEHNQGHVKPGVQIFTEESTKKNIDQLVLKPIGVVADTKETVSKSSRLTESLSKLDVPKQVTIKQPIPYEHHNYDHEHDDDHKHDHDHDHYQHGDHEHDHHHYQDHEHDHDHYQYHEHDNDHDHYQHGDH